MRKQIGRWLAGVTLLILCFVNIAPAAADTGTPVAVPGTAAATSNGPQFGIQPVGKFPHGYFEITLEPGKSESLKAAANNGGQEDVTLRAFAANVTSPPNGGFAAGAEEGAPTGPTAWLGFPAASFDLKPGARQEFPFTVAVPAGTAPGQYVTSLVVRTAQPVAIPGTTAFNQIIRSAVAIVITVPGPVNPGFTLGTPTFTAKDTSNVLEIPVTNTGNVLVKPEGTLTLTTPDGKPVINAPIAMGSVYGGLSSKLQIPVPDQMQPGDFIVSVKLTDKATGVTAEISNASAKLAPRAAPPQFTVDPITITPNANPVQFADVAITVNNAGANIPTAKVVLRVSKDGKPVEDYPLVQNQALATGPTQIMQRYIPAKGWEKGTYSFEVVVSSVSNSTETLLATVPVGSTIVVP